MNLKPLLCTVFLFILVLSGCDSGITYPAVSETQTEIYHPGQFVWHDLATQDPAAAMAFYGNVFGWQFEARGSGDNAYQVIKNQGKPIGGIFRLADKYGDESEWIGSMSVMNLEEAVSLNEEKGGKTIFSIASFEGRGRTALIQDPQGAILALLKSATGDPELRTVIDHGWLWNELWSTDLEGSLAFYQDLVPYEAEKVEQAKAPYYIFTIDDKKLSGALKNPIKQARSAWMPYIKVSDVNEIVAKAEAAGAYIVMKPNQEVRNGSVAVILDPVGAQFTVQEWRR